MKTIEYNPCLRSKTNTGRLRRMESDIKAMIYHKLLENNIESHLEYWINNPCHKYTRQRIDIIVVKDNQIICLVEVKDKSNRDKRAFYYQCKSMESTGLYCLYCFGMNDADRVVKDIVKYFNNAE